jgi:cellobiose-specific phosphotransferase system component IIC
MNAKKNSFQERINVKMEVATRPGATRGRTTLRNAFILVYPSTIAASSISILTSSKKAFIIHTEKEIVKLE